MNDKRKGISSRAVIYKDGKIFAQKLKDGPDKPKRNWWCLPGGRVETGEMVNQAVVREMIEETGVEPVVGRLMAVQQFNNGESGDYLEFFFEVTNADDYLGIDLSKTTHGLAEVDECGFIDPKTEIIYPRFLSEVDLSRHEGVYFYDDYKELGI